MSEWTTLSDEGAALIAALQDAGGASRELDHRLAAALGGGLTEAPRYTASLDCAHHHLHPDELYCRVDIAPAETAVVLYAKRGEAGIGDVRGAAQAATPALAYCIAALKARARIDRPGRVE